MFLYLRNSESTKAQINSEIELAIKDLNELGIHLKADFKLNTDIFLYEEETFDPQELPYFQNISLNCSLKIIPGAARNEEDDLFIKIFINPILVALKIDEEDNRDPIFKTERVATLKEKLKEEQIQRFNSELKGTRKFFLNITYRNLYVRFIGIC